MISSTGDFGIALPVSLSVAHTNVCDQPTPSGQIFSRFVRLKKQPAPAYHQHGITPPAVLSRTHPSASPSTHTTNGSTRLVNSPEIGHQLGKAGI
ncbi:hypothetical protein BKA70DRAFT_1407118, partial [Coprinopsis sp. MPI-PUGE-AT-0042]